MNDCLATRSLGGIALVNVVPRVFRERPSYGTMAEMALRCVKTHTDPLLCTTPAGPWAAISYATSKSVQAFDCTLEIGKVALSHRCPSTQILGQIPGDLVVRVIRDADLKLSESLKRVPVGFHSLVLRAHCAARTLSFDFHRSSA